MSLDDRVVKTSRVSMSLSLLQAGSSYHSHCFSNHESASYKMANCEMSCACTCQAGVFHSVFFAPCSNFVDEFF